MARFLQQSKIDCQHCYAACSVSILILTWEWVRRCDEVVGAELLWRLERLVAEVEADAHDLGAVEVGAAAAGGEELDLHLHVGVAVEEGVLQVDGARGEGQLGPQHALQRLERRVVGHVVEEGRAEVHDALVRVRAQAALRAQALPRRARPRVALHQARRVGRRQRPLRHVAVGRVGQPLAHRVPGQPAESRRDQMEMSQNPEAGAGPGTHARVPL